MSETDAAPDPQPESPGKTTPQQERRRARNLIKKIIHLGHRRIAGSDTERRAHELLDKEFQKAGLQTELIPFWTNQSLYRNMAFHFGVGFGGSVLVFYDHVLIALMLHLLAGLSYYWDSTKTKFVLRRLLPKAASQNLIARRPVEAAALRIVMMAHADAAFTGKAFDPEVLKGSRPESYPAPFKFIAKGLKTATYSLFVLAVLDVLILFGLDGAWMHLLVIIASIPTTIAFALNSEVVYRNQVVPGASDNLSGCAALLLLADRLEDSLPAGVEVEYVVTGAEEAGVCGSTALRRKMQGRWNQANTIIVAVDTLVGGELVILRDGEVVTTVVPQWLANAATRAAEPIEALERIQQFEIPSGATDAAPWIYDGYEGIGIGSVDFSIGAPRNYHLPSDTLDNFDFDEFAVAIDFLENFVQEIAAHRLGKTS